MSTGFGEPITPDPSQKQSRTPRTREEQKKDGDEEEEEDGEEEEEEEDGEEEQKDPLGGEDQLWVKGERGSDEGEILSRL